LNVRGGWLGLKLLQFTFKGKKIHTLVACLGLSPAFLAQFTLEMCVATRNREKFTTIFYFVGSRSFTVDIPKKLVASACYDKQHERAYLQPFSPI